ncbi:RNA polymerase sigma factor [Tropicimonas sp. S265A]|uniref:RNA polymerase sigma factor n=1 Tax=Tropicimonas sp. S265A TaxID=3415134 RepID=UPI003C7EA8A6
MSGFPSVRVDQRHCMMEHGGAQKWHGVPIFILTLRELALSTDLKRDMIALLPRLRRFARALTRSVAEADDLVQEACLRALSRADQWDRSQPLDRWMFRITRNLWISEMRKRGVRLGQGHVPAEETTELVSQETGEHALAATELRGRIDALPEDLASILLTVSVEGYSYAEAAELFEIPVGTVMSRIHRARKALAREIALAAGEDQ